MALTEEAVSWNLRDEAAPSRRNVYIPAELLNRYVDVALQGAIPQPIEGETWYADLPRFPGVWADAPSPKQCLDTLAEVLRDWLILKIVDQDRDIPVIDEIDLNAL